MENQDYEVTPAPFKRAVKKSHLESWVIVSSPMTDEQRLQYANDKVDSELRHNPRAFYSGSKDGEEQ